MRRALLAVMIGGAMNAATAAPGWYYEYSGATITDLGVLAGDTSSTAYDINDYGVIVGDSVNNTVSRAFVYNGTMSVIDDGLFVNHAYARGINNNGEIVGYLHNSQDPSYVDRAWYSALGLGTVFTLNSNPQAPLSYNWSMRAYAINDAGVIVGGGTMDFASSNDPIPNVGGDCYSHLPVRWNGFQATAEMIFCPADAANNIPTIAYDINNNGDTVGADNGTTALRMFIKKGPFGAVQSIPEPSNPSAPNPQGFKYGQANSVSNTGRVTGFYSVGGVIRAFYWNSVSANSYDLGVLPGGNISIGREVNDQGFVAGYSEYTHYSVFTQSTYYRKAAFIWGGGIGMIKLPTLSSGTPFVVPGNCEAYALNNRVESTGRIQVVGYCQTGGQSRAVRWDVTVTKKYSASVQP